MYAGQEVCAVMRSPVRMLQREASQSWVRTWRLTQLVLSSCQRDVANYMTSAAAL